MKQKTETNPKGSGRGLSQKRLSLKRANLIMLLQSKNVQQLAVLFDVSMSMINAELTYQLQNKTIGFTVLEPKEEIDISKGAWMNSPERKSLIEYRLKN